MQVAWLSGHWGWGGAEPAQPVHGGGSPLLKRPRSLGFISVALEKGRRILKSRQSQQQHNNNYAQTAFRKPEATPTSQAQKRVCLVRAEATFLGVWERGGLGTEGDKAAYFLPVSNAVARGLCGVKVHKLRVAVTWDQSLMASGLISRDSDMEGTALHRKSERTVGSRT